MPNEIDFKSPVEAGFSFEKPVRLSVDDISEFATLSGDLNPLHHKARIAGASRFGGIIASGTHSGSLLMGSVATYLAPGFLTLGLSFELEFRAPVRPGIELLIHWEVKTVEPKPSLAGYIVTVEGGIADKGKDLAWCRGACLIVNEST
ncbi:MAG: MaoC/PaaZ C-terminal domain-containing protein [Deltaproteobacteria bacterium]